MGGGDHRFARLRIGVHPEFPPGEVSCLQEILGRHAVGAGGNRVEDDARHDEVLLSTRGQGGGRAGYPDSVRWTRPPRREALR